MVHISILVLNSMYMFVCCFYFCASLFLHVDILGSTKRLNQMVLCVCVFVCVCVPSISPLNKVVVTSCCNTVNFPAVSDNMLELKASGTEATLGAHF
jgi:hypothetical protein